MISKNSVPAEVQDSNTVAKRYSTNLQMANKPITKNRENKPTEAMENTGVYKGDLLLLGKKASYKFRLNDGERVKSLAVLGELCNILREKQEKDAEEEYKTKIQVTPTKTYTEVTATKQAHTIPAGSVRDARRSDAPYTYLISQSTFRIKLPSVDSFQDLKIVFVCM
ncbi:hypothetical protein HNY73_007002 [Argiope bruennichi]|uniref:Uncharacterized protein n=1 Tax=Argiope bruennichi TaxID=94029 RepID=A0A8T0FI53_ARGBR|nr:hypothetical protein HNY73_007002 [Argiope bruennichi]